MAFQNINGISYDKYGLGYDEVFQTMKDRNVDIFGLAEPNVDWHWDFEVLKMQASACKVLQHVHTIATTSSLSYKTTFKPGGVLSGVV